MVLAASNWPLIGRRLDSKRNRGFTLIEIIIVLAILAILIWLAIFAYRWQLSKARDGRRKADLDKMQKIFEDYLNDKGCYPDLDEVGTDVPGASGLKSICQKSLSPYASSLPCDPLNTKYHHYFYSFDQNESCKTWYKIYIRLENENDPEVATSACAGACGPSGNFNDWTSSPNMDDSGQQHPGEDWWPVIEGELAGRSCQYGRFYGCFNGQCLPLTSWCAPNFCNSAQNCAGSCRDGGGQVVPGNECR